MATDWNQKADRTKSEHLRPNAAATLEALQVTDSEARSRRSRQAIIR